MNLINIILYLTIFSIVSCYAPSNPELPSLDTINPNNDSQSKISGVVVDSYIRNASICIDMNQNGICEFSEPTTISNNNGEFEFDIIATDELNLLPLIASGGIDCATGKELIWGIKNNHTNK